MSALGMVNFQSNNELRTQEKEEQDKQAQARQNQPFILGLAHDLRGKWEAAKAAKSIVEQDMLIDMRNRKGEYDSIKLAEIMKMGGSTIFMMLAEEKAGAVTAWLKDIFFGNTNDKIWSTKTSPIPDLRQDMKAKIVQKVFMEAQGEMRDMVEAEILAGVIKSKGQAQERLSTLMVERMEEMAAEVQEAEQAAANKAENRIETKLDDLVVDSGLNDTLAELMDDVNTFRCAILKGPYQVIKKKIVWNQAPGEQKELPQAPGQPPERPVSVKDVPVWRFDRVSALDIYPLDDAENFDQGFFHRHKSTKAKFFDLKKIKGFDSDATDMVLQNHPGDWLNVSIDYTREALEDRHQSWRKSGGKIDILQYWGDVQGLQLLQYGIDPALIPEPLSSYKSEVWLVGNVVIKAELNGNPLGKVPYHKTGFRKNNGSFWDKSSLSLFRDSVDACNASARNMLNNAAIASGPQVGIDTSQVREGDHVTSMYPWKVWTFDGSTPGAMSNRDPLKFFMPPSTIEALIKLYTFFSEQADEKTGVPKYSYGGTGNKGGPINTASGYSMMMNQVLRGIKDVVRNFDRDLIAPAIEYLYEMQLLYSNDPEWFQSDIRIIAQGSISLIMKETAALRRNEFLAMATNPAIMQIIGIEGLSEVLRAVAEGLDLPSGNIVPTREKIERTQKMMSLVAQTEESPDKPPEKEVA